MNLKDISIATITWATNEAENLLLEGSLTELAKLHLPVYITDAGSTKSFLSFLDSGIYFHLHNGTIKGVWPQARNSLLHAMNAGAEYIFYTEPDKKDFFEYSLSSIPDSIEGDVNTGIILASRSAKAFATFPAFQQMTETTINNCCAELIGEYVDYTYGPFLIRREIIPHLQQLPDEIGWGWRPFAFNIAKRLGYSVTSVEGDFFCPQDQREDPASERIYRMKQLQQNIEGLVLSTTASL
jgi:hypothetical protein